LIVSCPSNVGKWLLTILKSRGLLCSIIVAYLFHEDFKRLASTGLFSVVNDEGLLFPPELLFGAEEVEGVLFIRFLIETEAMPGLGVALLPPATGDGEIIVRETVVAAAFF
jgi:hypothetical protein